MIMQQEGSVLLTIVLLTTMSLFFCLLCWQMTITSHNLVLTKQEADQQRQLINTLMIWAVDLCKNNFETIQYYKKNYKKELSFELPGWVVHNKVYNGSLSFSSKDDVSVAIKIIMRKPQQYKLSCSVTREFNDGDVRYKINDYVVS